MMNPKRVAAAGYRFSVIPAGAITDVQISPRDLQVLCLLGRHTDNQGWCTRSQVRMAGELHCARSTVQKALDHLEHAGYIVRQLTGRWHAAPDPEKQPFSSYAYRVILDLGAGKTARGCHTEVAPPCHAGAAPVIEHTTDEHTLSEPAPNAQRVTSDRIPDDDAADVSDGAALMAAWPEIWQAYAAVPGVTPVMNEMRAKRALQRVIREEPALPSPKEVISAIGVYARAVAIANATRSKPMFVPHPHTWLSEKRWLQYRDAASAARSQSERLEAQAREAAMALGTGGFDKLVAAGLTLPEICGWFAGASGGEDPGGPVIYALTPFKARAISERFLEKLRSDAAFGPKLRIAVRSQNAASATFSEGGANLSG